MQGRSLWQLFGGVLLIALGAVIALGISLSQPLTIALGIAILVVGILLLANK
jgi:hypothetical protein